MILMFNVKFNLDGLAKHLRLVHIKNRFLGVFLLLVFD